MIENDWGIVICATVLLIAVKILSRLQKGVLLHWCHPYYGILYPAPDEREGDPYALCTFGGNNPQYVPCA